MLILLGSFLALMILGLPVALAMAVGVAPLQEPVFDVRALIG